jgi:Ni/Fe-hydrogenase subunit HybB-like protein
MRPNEQRLDQLRHEALSKGVVTGNGIDIAGGPVPIRLDTGRVRPTGGSGYYGEPVVRPPVWTWEIPVYFFVGGLAGMSAVIAAAAAMFHHPEIVSPAMWIAAGGVVLSPILLILDLGRPQLFINMLRVFKPQSAMSMGVWVLTFFGFCVVPGLAALELHRAHLWPGVPDQALRVVAGLLIAGSAVFGMLLATYTGVLLGATAIPAWFLHRRLLPIHFGTAGLGSAAAILELLGYRIPPLHAVGFLAAGVETLLMVWLSLNRHGAADRACHHGFAGWLIRTGEFLSGPFSLVLRLFSFVPIAGISFLAGSLVSRFGWLAAGRNSGRDPEAVFASQR